MVTLATADSVVTAAMVAWHLALASWDPMATAATVATAETVVLAETAETAPTVTKLLLQVAAVASVATVVWADSEDLEDLQALAVLVALAATVVLTGLAPMTVFPVRTESASLCLFQHDLTEIFPDTLRFGLRYFEM